MPSRVQQNKPSTLTQVNVHQSASSSGRCTSNNVTPIAIMTTTWTT